MQKNKDEIQQCLQRGLNFIAKKQKKDGSFRNLTSLSKKFIPSSENSAVFSTCLILSSLSSLKSASGVKSAAATFLMSQKSDFWSWNYWKRNSIESKKMPYPEDLDDSFCALSALLLHDKKLVPTKVIAKILMLLTACEKSEGGPYYTWLVSQNSKSIWKDVDLAVNSNIAFFLSLQGVFLPKLSLLVAESISRKQYYSQYYHSQYSVIYFISRWYRKKNKNEIVDNLFSKRQEDGSWGNSLDTALAINALINFGCKKTLLEKSVLYLLKNQSDGAWKAYPFVIEKIRDGKKYYSGSSELTSAFCLEALEKYLNKKRNGKKLKKQNFSLESKNIHAKIVSNVTLKAKSLDFSMQEIFLTVLKKTLKSDKTQQITLLPYYFQKSLGFSSEKSIAIKLGQANLFGWIAYTIYDDFYDSEGRPELLSVANICLRELTLIFGKIFSGRNVFLKFFRSILDEIDQANQWEYLNCRAAICGNFLKFPAKMPDWENNLNKLSQRSLGHALGPIALQFENGIKLDSQEIKNTLLFFHHYIIARQLNDDAHDWETDLLRGQLSPVVTLILKTYVKAGKDKEKLNLKTDIKELRNLFWKKIISKVCKDVLFHVKEARRSLKKNKELKDVQFLEELLFSVENVAKKAKDEQCQMREFLNGCQ